MTPGRFTGRRDVGGKRALTHRRIARRVAKEWTSARGGAKALSRQAIVGTSESLRGAPMNTTCTETAPA